MHINNILIHKSVRLYSKIKKKKEIENVLFKCRQVKSKRYNLQIIDLLKAQNNEFKIDSEVKNKR